MILKLIYYLLLILLLIQIISTTSSDDLTKRRIISGGGGGGDDNNINSTDTSVSNKTAVFDTITAVSPVPTITPTPTSIHTSIPESTTPPKNCQMACGVNQSCIETDKDKYNCVLFDRENEIAIVQIMEKTAFNNQYSSIRMHISNYGSDKTVTQIRLVVDETFTNTVNLNSLWNIQYSPENNTISLPSFLAIPPKTSHIFGFTMKGSQTPNIVIDQLVTEPKSSFDSFLRMNPDNYYLYFRTTD